MGTVVCDKCGGPAKYTHSNRRGDVHKCPQGHTTYYDADNKPERYRDPLLSGNLEDDLR